MADAKDDERDEEWFKEVYGKEYTGPTRPSHDNATDDTNAKKRKTNLNAGDSDGDDEPRDPNAVPTDFTSREAKVWEAKAKAIERNWKRRKEEELICRLCGEAGHFTQGCPTTLGSNRKTREIVERIPFKDKRLRPRIIGIGGAIIQNIEKDTGCRLKVEDNLTVGNGAFFVRISGTDRIMVSKAVDAVNKLVDPVDDDQMQSTRHRQGSYNRVSNENPIIAAQMQHIAAQRMQQNPNMQPYLGRSDAPPRDDQHTIEQIASQLEARRQWESGSKDVSDSLAAYVQRGGGVATGAGNIANIYGPGSDRTSPYYGQQQEDRANKKKGGASDLKEQEQEQDMDLGYEQPVPQPLPKTLEELEHRFLQDTMELTKEQNYEEDKENARHRECLREIQEQYQQKMIALRAQQAKQREEFLQRESQMRQQQYQQSAGINYYNYNPSVPIAGLNGRPHDRVPHDRGPHDRGSHEHLGYGTGVDAHRGYGSSYPSYKEEGQYYSSLYPYNRSLGYDAGNLYRGNRGYDSAPYPY